MRRRVRPLRQNSLSGLQLASTRCFFFSGFIRKVFGLILDHDLNPHSPLCQHAYSLERCKFLASKDQSSRIPFLQESLSKDEPFRNLLEENVLRALPKHEFPQRGELLVSLPDRQEVTPCERAHFTGEIDAPVR